MDISGEAMLNRERKKKGLVFYNKKRIYRVMDKNGLNFKEEKGDSS